MKSTDLVAPRDIFNRANFEFNIATLMRAVQCNVISNIVFDSSLYEEFGIRTVMDCGNDLELSPSLFYKRNTMEPLVLKRSLNSRNRFSLYLELEDYEVIDVFTEKGELSLEFADYIGESNVDEPVEIGDCFTPAAAQANYLKLIARVAMNSVNGVLVNVRFDQEAYSTEDIVISSAFGFNELLNNYFSLDDQELCLSMGVDRTVGNFLVFWDEKDRDYYKVFDDKGKFTNDFLTYVKQPEESWHAIQS